MLGKRLIDRLIEVASKSGITGSASSQVTMDDIYQFYLNLYDSIDNAEKSMFLAQDSITGEPEVYNYEPIEYNFIPILEMEEVGEGKTYTERDECNTDLNITNLFCEE